MTSYTNNRMKFMIIFNMPCILPRIPGTVLSVGACFLPQILFSPCRYTDRQSLCLRLYSTIYLFRLVHTFQIIDELPVALYFCVSQFCIETVCPAIPDRRIKCETLYVREHRLNFPHHKCPVSLAEMLRADKYPPDIQHVPVRKQDGPADNQPVIRQFE